MSVREDLKAYLDGELDPARTDEIRIALDQDPALYKEYLELKAVGVGLARFAAQPRAQGLERTLSALGTAKRRPTWDRRILLPVGLAAAFFGVAFFLMMGDHGVTSQPASGQSNLVASNFEERSEQKAKRNAAAPAAPTSSLDKESYLAQPSAKASGPAPPRAQSERRARTKYRFAPVEGIDSSGFATNIRKVPASGSIKLSPPAPKPQTVVLVFDSPEIGEKKVLDLVGAYRVQPSNNQPVSQSVTEKLPPIKDGPETIVVEVPDATADLTLKQLKGLPNVPSALPPARGSFGGFGGAMGGGGRGGSGEPGSSFGARAGGGIGGGIGGGAGASMAGGGTATTSAAQTARNGTVAAPPGGAAVRSQNAAAMASNVAKANKPASSKLLDANAFRHVKSSVDTRTKSPAIRQGEQALKVKMRRIVILIVKKPEPVTKLKPVP